MRFSRFSFGDREWCFAALWPMKNHSGFPAGLPSPNKLYFLSFVTGVPVSVGLIHHVIPHHSDITSPVLPFFFLVLNIFFAYPAIFQRFPRRLLYFVCDPSYNPPPPLDHHSWFSFWIRWPSLCLLCACRPTLCLPTFFDLPFTSFVCPFLFPRVSPFCLLLFPPLSWSYPWQETTPRQLRLIIYCSHLGTFL